MTPSRNIVLIFLQHVYAELYTADSPEVNKVERVVEPSINNHIPNVRTFKVRMLSEYHPIFLEEGIKKREYKAEFDSEKYTNRSINRYLDHQLIRLRKSRTNPAKFWAISKYLLNSPTFQVCNMTKIFPVWHRTMKYGSVWEIMTEVRNLSRELTQNKELSINFIRKFIPKPDGSQRPLGIPTPAWRVVLHGLNILMVIFFTPYQNPNQHGFWPGKGTDTAWKQIHTQVLNSPNIYEFDLSKFFDTINLTYLKQILESIELPKELIRMIDKLNRSLPQNNKPLPLTWRTEQEKLADYNYMKTGIYNELSNPIRLELVKRSYQQELAQHPEYAQFEYFRGVPQGSPLSPLLASIALHANLLKNNNIVQYADDGIIYDTPKPEELLNFPKASGISQNMAKSKWIKRDGVWLTSLKFLGKRYIPANLLTKEQLIFQKSQDGILCNSTRTEKNFVFDSYELVREAHQYDIQQSAVKTQGLVSPCLDRKGQSFKEWFETKYFGFVNSRIYNGTLNMDKIMQDFNYTFVKWSWSYLESQRPLVRKINGEMTKVKLTTFNSSSFAAKALVLKLQHYNRCTKLANRTHRP